MTRRIWAAMVGATAMAGCGPTTTASNNATTAASTPQESDLKLGTGDVTTKNLVAFAKAKLAFKPKDQFEKGFDDNVLEGRHFDIKMPISGNDKQKSSANFSYDADNETLNITLWPEPNSVHHDDDTYFGPSFDYMIVDSEETMGDPQAMSNAFGVTKSVIPTFTTQIGVGSFKGDYMGVVPRDKASSDKDQTMYSMTNKTIRMSPAEARAATTDIWIEISGVVRRPTDGHIIECDESTKKATLTYNYEEHWSQCVISSKLERVAVVSRTAGVLIAWPSSARIRH